MTNTATLLPAGYDLSGVPGAIKVRNINNSPKDVALLGLPNVLLYLDPSSPSFSLATKSGYSLANAGSGKYLWTAASITAVTDATKAAAQPNWNQQVLSFAGNDGDLHFQPSLSPASFAFLFVGSIGTGGLPASAQRFLISGYDAQKTQASGQRLSMFADASGNKQFSFSPDPNASGNGFNFGAGKVPADNTKFILLVTFDATTLIMTAYLNDPTTPLATNTYLAARAASSTNSYYIGNAIASTSLGFVGEIAQVVFFGDANIPADVRAAMFAQLKTAYGI